MNTYYIMTRISLESVEYPPLLKFSCFTYVSDTSFALHCVLHLAMKTTYTTNLLVACVA